MFLRVSDGVTGDAVMSMRIEIESSSRSSSELSKVCTLHQLAHADDRISAEN